MAELKHGGSLDLRRNSDMADHRAIDDDLSDFLDPLEVQPNPEPGLSFAEKKNLVLLCALHFIHAIPLQFSWVTMPILLRQQLSYSDVGTFLISQYPYSWKVAWSPLVDAFHVPLMGRRKTWIVPSCILAGSVLLWLAFAQDSLVTEIANGRPLAMIWVVLAWFTIMVACASIRIALDSWSLDLLSPPNVHWASSVATIGETFAGLVSFNAFLGMTYVKSPKDEAGNVEPANTRLFFEGSAIAFAITAVLLLVGKTENDKGLRRRTIGAAYTIIWKILKLRQVWILMLIHMASMIGFITNDTITVLQLVKNNFDDLELAGLGTATIPFAVAGGYLVAKAFETRHPLYVWRKMFPWRLSLAFISQLTILFISRYPDSQLRWLVVLLPFCLSRFFEAAMWVAFVAFHAQVSNPQYGGIYMSLLATTLNIRYDTLQFFFTKMIGTIDGSEDLTAHSKLIDGYQIMNISSVILAIPIFWFFLKPATMYLETINVSAWWVEDTGHVDPAAYEMVRTTEDNTHEA
jgi:MFS transporter, PAT family, solute carrier family 33 (acetyl-CoA transportor), member 1